MSQHSSQPDRTPGELRALSSFDGARLEYEVAGTGPPLIMLHGLLAAGRRFPGNAARWQGSADC